MRKEKYKAKCFKLNEKTILNLAELKKHYTTYNQLFVDLIKLKSKIMAVKEIRINFNVKVGDICPHCQTGDVIEVIGKYGKFLGCSQFPNCAFTQKIKITGKIWKN